MTLYGVVPFIIYAGVVLSSSCILAVMMIVYDLRWQIKVRLFVFLVQHLFLLGMIFQRRMDRSSEAERMKNHLIFLSVFSWTLLALFGFT